MQHFVALTVEHAQAVQKYN